MPKFVTWSLGFVLAITTALLGASPPAHADTSWPPAGCEAADSSAPGTEAYTAPAPCKLDPDGDDQDQVCYPATTFDHPIYGAGMYRVDGVAQAAGCHSTHGAASVTVITSYDSGTWTFDFTNDQSGEEAENKYWVEVGAGCKVSNYGEKYTEVTAYFTNVADSTNRFVHSIHPATTNVDGTFASDVDTAFDIADGQTVAMRVMIFADEVPGLTPGTWIMRFRRSDTGNAGSEGYVVKTLRFTVPECGGMGGSGRKARGALRQVGCMAVRVTANAVRYDATPMVHYQVYRHARGHRPHHRNIVVAAGQKRVILLKKPPRRAVVFTLKVQRPNGRWQWLDTQGVPRCS